MASEMIVSNGDTRDPDPFGLLLRLGSPKLRAQSSATQSNSLMCNYIRYPSRDGHQIPAYVTVPNGEGPHPLIVLPHGGPAVNGDFIR